MAENLRRTALYDEHLKLSGRIVPFAGWELKGRATTVIVGGRIKLQR